MTQKTNTLLIIPIDGSANALRAVDYVGRFFGRGSRAAIHFLYVIPALPPILVDEARHNRETAVMLKKMEAKYTSLAETALDAGRQRLQRFGFADQQIKTTIHARALGVAQDICHWAEKKSADAVVMSSRGLGRLGALFMGATAAKVIDASELCPVWIIRGKVSQQGVLIAVDHSEEALRALDHAGYILADGEHPITLFYSRRKLTSLVPRQVAASAPELDRIWRDRAGQAIAPVMEKARQMLVDAGVDQSRITVRVTEGSRSAATDIIKTARQLKCGTISVGRRGAAAQSAFRMGSVSRKVAEGAEDTAVWIVP
jgi:nucleotide-binding universal stress UspA family protein